MSFVEDIVNVLPFLRSQAESLMIDACTVERPGELVTDAEGNVSPALSLVYEGECKVQKTATQAANPSAGGHQFTLQDSRVDFPVSAGPLAVDDVVTLTASVLDPQLAGRSFRVTELFHKSYATAQRTTVSEVVA